MKKYIVILVCLVCLSVPFPAQAGLSDSIQSFFAVKEARNIGRHNALNFGTEQSPKYVIMNSIGPDAMTASGDIPSWSIDSDAANKNPFSWGLVAQGACSKLCGGGVQVKSYGCVDKTGKAVDEELCFDQKPEDIMEPCNTAPCVLVSCKQILDAGLSKGDGSYRLVLDGETKEVWCDMTTDGGGWTVLYSKGIHASDGSTAIDCFNNVLASDKSTASGVIKWDGTRGIHGSTSFSRKLPMSLRNVSTQLRYRIVRSAKSTKDGDMRFILGSKWVGIVDHFYDSAYKSWTSFSKYCNTGWEASSCGRHYGWSQSETRTVSIPANDSVLKLYVKTASPNDRIEYAMVR